MLNFEYHKHYSGREIWQRRLLGLELWVSKDKYNATKNRWFFRASRSWWFQVALFARNTNYVKLNYVDSASVTSNEFSIQIRHVDFKLATHKWMGFRFWTHTNHNDDYGHGFFTAGWLTFGMRLPRRVVGWLKRRDEKRWEREYAETVEAQAKWFENRFDDYANDEEG